MVYIRTKKVKGIEYAYLVHSKWDQKTKTSKQETIKYLGKISDITQDDIPSQYRDEQKITIFLSSHNVKNIEQTEKLLVKIRKKLFSCLIDGDLDGALEIYSSFTRSSPLLDFYEKLLKKVMYEIGNLWEKNKLSPATEHVASNVAHGLVKIITNRTPSNVKKNSVLICTPEGEWHNLGCNIVESVLTTRGYKVINISPSSSHYSIIGYIEKTAPEAVLVSVTLKENVKSAQRLIRKIHEKFSVPIIVGGQGIKDANLGDIAIECSTFDEIFNKLRTLKKK